MANQGYVLVEEPIIQGTISRPASWKAFVFFAFAIGLATFRTLPYKPSDNVPPTALWSPAVGRMPSAPRFANVKSLTPFHRIAGARSMHMGGNILRALKNEATETTEMLDISNITKVNLLSSAEVPPQIPRDDLMDQIAQWSENEIAEGNPYGLPMTVERMYKFIDDGVVLWGFKVTIMRDSNVVCDIGWLFDDDIQIKYQFLSKDKNGMPQQAGRKEEILGKNVQVWKLDDKPVTEDDKVVIKRLCAATSAAINAYYSFGSVYSEGI